MGVLQRFERRIESIVSGAFARAFKSEVQPVEVAAALQRECDDRAAIVARGRTMVPNDFVVELGPHDSERLGPYAAAITGELADMVREHAEEQGYSFIGPVKVAFEEIEELETGRFRVRSSAVAGVEPHDASPAGGPAQGWPAAGPAPGAGARDRSPQAGSGAAQGGAAQGGATPAPYVAGSPAAGPAGSPAPGAPGPGRAGAPGSTRPTRASGPQGRPTPRPTARVEIGGSSYPLTRAVTVLGRGEAVDLRIEDPGVSRRHAEIRLQDDLAEMVDLGSTNGLVVGGHRTERVALSDGTVVRLGSTEIVFRRGQG